MSEPRDDAEVPEPSYRALVCVTTCRRLEYLQRCLPHFARLLSDDPRFSILVSLDGTEERYLRFCEEWSVPLVYSDEREGVGLSKNRVLERFPDFDYYFFLDDDAEPVHGWPFPLHVRLAVETGIHHFSAGVRRVTGKIRVRDRVVCHGLIGGGQFNFFTAEGLQRVGGWHTDFARYRRWGHTEHSHRFPRVGLAPAPFNAVMGLGDAFIWHSPVPVTKVPDAKMTEDELAAPELEVMARELDHFPVTTLSPHHFNGEPFGALGPMAGAVEEAGRYPLLQGRTRRQARADYHLWQGMRSGPVSRLGWLALSAAEWPSNPMLRHRLKELLPG